MQPMMTANYTEAPIQKKNKQLFSKSFLLLVTLILLLATGVGFLGYKYYTLEKEYKSTSEKKFEEVSNSVKKLMNIDESEEMRVAEINNIDELKAQDEKFYKEARNGHFLIVLAESQRVLIYDKELNRIVNFSNYTIAVDPIPEDKIPESEKPLNIEIRAEESITDAQIIEVEEAINNLGANYEVIGSTRTTIDYTEGNIFVLNQQNKPNLSQNIIAYLKASGAKTQLPDGEKSTNADVVILLATN